MTEPMDQPASELVVTGAQALVDTARRLGLIWVRRPGTVTVFTSVDDVSVTLDGDSVPVRAVSLAGSFAFGGRVMVDIVPPSANFIVGPLTEATTVHDFQSAQVGTTSITYVLSATICGVAFVVPSSGKVLLHWRTLLDNSGAADAAFCSPEIRTGSTPGSGTVVVAANDNRAVALVGTDGTEFGSSSLLTSADGLTPGALLNASLWQRSSVGTNTATVARREIIVVPAT